MPHSTTIAETVTAESGSKSGSAEAIGSAAGSIGNAGGGVRSAESGSTAPARNSGPYWLAENLAANDGQDAQDTRTETAEPARIPRVFPVYAFI